MPQIWPMNWVFLLVIFILTFLSFLVLIYFFKTSSVLEQSKWNVSDSSQVCDWKW